MAHPGIAVLNEQFVAPMAVQLKLREKVFTWSGDDFSIKEVNTGATWFKVKGKAFSFRDRKEFFDAHGNVVATMTETPLSLRGRMKVVGNGFEFEVQNKLKFFGSEAKAVVTDKRTGQQHNIYMHGNWLDKDLKIYLGKKKEGGRLIAEANRKLGMQQILFGQEEYILRVEPGFDVAMCVIMCIAFDEFQNESG